MSKKWLWSIGLLVLVTATVALAACTPQQKAPSETTKPATSVSSVSEPTTGKAAAEDTLKVSVAEPVHTAAPESSATAEGSAAPAAPREVVAKVDGREVYKDDLDRALDMQRQRKMMQAMQNPGAAPQSPAMTAQDQMDVLNKLIDYQILILLAKKANIAVTDDEVAEKLKGIMERVPSKEVFDQIMKSRGITPEKLNDTLREQMLVEKFMKQQTEGGQVSDEDLKKAYEEVKAKGLLNTPETMDVAHILAKVESKAPKAAGSEGSEAEGSAGSDNAAAWKAAKEKIDTAYKRVTEGKEDFGKVADELTDDPGSKGKGGKYENVPRGQMVAEFDKLMWETPIGTVTEPFKTEYGYHILKPLAKHEAGVQSMESIKDKLTEYVKNEKANEKLEQLTKDARKDLKVEIMYTAKDEPAPPAPTSGLPANHPPITAAPPMPHGTAAPAAAEPAGSVKAETTAPAAKAETTDKK